MHKIFPELIVDIITLVYLPALFNFVQVNSSINRIYNENKSYICKKIADKLFKKKYGHCISNTNNDMFIHLIIT